jgi:hypothetical protein
MHKVIKTTIFSPFFENSFVKIYKFSIFIIIIISEKLIEKDSKFKIYSVYFITQFDVITI